ncbi:MAG: hypothetical protein PHU98_06395 [Mariniphaga sp.]|nr:hypothetical protein [Paludibacter sp.]MDD4226001.1 hypothetical protein [Mariniphaga sp.]
MEAKKYLKNGAEVFYFGKYSESQHMVRSIYVDDCGDEWPDDNIILVSEVFDTPPKQKIDLEFLEASEMLSAAKMELSKINTQLQSVKKEKTDLNRLIINREDILKAKRITVFIGDKLEPTDAKIKTDNIRLSFEVGISNGKVNVWHAKIYDDCNYSSGNFIDQKYGVMCDLTDEELLEITKKRILEIPKEKINVHHLITCHDKYLNPELIKRKKELMAEEQAKEIAKFEKIIYDYQVKLENLKK